MAGAVNINDVLDSHIALEVSSKMTGGRPFLSRPRKIAATPVYGLPRLWRGP
jgi:hypothetical protein